MAEGKRSRAWLWILLGAGVFFIFVFAIFALLYFSLRETGESADYGGGFGDKIAVVDLEGVITEAKPVVTQLRKYGNDDSIKAIILHINCPGGGAAATQEIYAAVKRIRDQKKKRIVASIETVGASGAYYVAAGTNKIFADPSSIVGSIGVIAQWYNYGDLIHWAKLKDETLKAGELKDAGSPTRPITPQERQYLQGLIDDMHQQFIKDVAEGRKMKVDEVRPIATGRVWTGEQAAPLKLVDQLGDFQTAVEDTAKAVGIKGEPTLVRPEKPRRSVWDLLFNDVSDLLPDRAKLMQSNIGFYYLWR
jgi:protease IV